METKLRQMLKVNPIEISRVVVPSVLMRDSSDNQQIDELSQSILQVGLLQPIVVKPEGEVYELVAGWRRLQACKKLGLEYINACFYDGNVTERVAVTTVENYQRLEVNAMEEAIYLSTIQVKLGLSQSALAKLIGKSESYVSERVAVLDYPDNLKQAVIDNSISFSSARELGRIKNRRAQDELIGFALRSGVTPDVAKAWRIQANEAEVNRIDNSEFEIDVNEVKVSAEVFLMQKCSICATAVRVTDLNPAWLCRGCFDAIMNH